MNPLRWVVGWLCDWREALREWTREADDPLFDSDFPDIDSDFGCPDTQPTSPGALDSDCIRIEAISTPSRSQT